jgi:hypothetical protein
MSDPVKSVILRHAAQARMAAQHHPTAGAYGVRLGGGEKEREREREGEITKLFALTPFAVLLSSLLSSFFNSALSLCLSFFLSFWLTPPQSVIVMSFI